MNTFEQNEAKSTFLAVVIGILIIIGIIWSIVFGIQYFKVFSSEQSGKAELAQAEWNRQIIVRQAQAKKDAATLEAEAAITKAHGVSEANRIIANGLGGPEGYLRYLYIEMLMEQKDKQIIYIPTEAGLPILEAGKR